MRVVYLEGRLATLSDVEEALSDLTSLVRDFSVGIRDMIMEVLSFTGTTFKAAVPCVTNFAYVFTQFLNVITSCGSAAFTGLSDCLGSSASRIREYAGLLPSERPGVPPPPPV